MAAGYNRVRIVQLLLQYGGDVHAKDKGGLGESFVWIDQTFVNLLIDSCLVPLHNSCSYGHFEVSEILIKHGADVNAVDHWQVIQLSYCCFYLLMKFCFIY